jgi:hypothetical protein
VSVEIKKERYRQSGFPLRRYSTVMHGVKEIPYENMKRGFHLATTQRRGLFQSEPDWDKTQHSYVDWRRQEQAKEQESRKRKEREKEQEEVVPSGTEEDGDTSEEEEDDRASRLRRRRERKARRRVSDDETPAGNEQEKPDEGESEKVETSQGSEYMDVDETDHDRTDSDADN